MKSPRKPYIQSKARHLCFRLNIGLPYQLAVVFAFGRKNKGGNDRGHPVNLPKREYHSELLGQPYIQSKAEIVSFRLNIGFTG